MSQKASFSRAEHHLGLQQVFLLLFIETFLESFVNSHYFLIFLISKVGINFPSYGPTWAWWSPKKHSTQMIHFCVAVCDTKSSKSLHLVNFKWLPYYYGSCRILLHNCAKNEDQGGKYTQRSFMIFTLLHNSYFLFNAHLGGSNARIGTAGPLFLFRCPSIRDGV